MASSETEICNLALSHLGVGKEIAALETERSDEASACRRFYDTARDETLRDFAWPFATKIAALGLLTDSDDDDHPTEEWTYQYQEPSDSLAFRKIQSGTRNDSRASRISYRKAYGEAGTVIFTDQEDAIGEYTIRVDDPQRYPSDFVMAFSFRLAALIAPRLTAGDPFKMAERSIRLYQLEISKAQASAFNEEQTDEDPDSEFIRARE
jgi:hypothetical protein